MAHAVCPWWLGYVLAHPLRRLWQNPEDMLRPFVAGGMTVLEPGCGMGFFTIDLARQVGPRGRVVAIDVQPRMLNGLRRRARKAGLLDRIDARLVQPEGLGVEDLDGRVDFSLAFAMVHELPDQERFFAEVHRALKPAGALLVAEPRGHVTEEAFAVMLTAGAKAGFVVEGGPAIRSSWTAVFRRA
jgi:ubiquinone/menaquinone biosynthesis C-methylase UbiE